MIKIDVGVGHENLRAAGTSIIHTPPGGSPRRQRLRVTNLLAAHSRG